MSIKKSTTTQKSETVKTKSVKKTVAKNQLSDEFHQIFQHGPMGMATVSKDFYILSANEKFCKLIGYTEKELQKLRFPNFTHPDHIKQDAESIGKIITGELEVYKTEKRYIRKDKIEIWCNVSVTALFDDNNKFHHFLVMLERFDESLAVVKMMQKINKQSDKIADRLQLQLDLYLKASELRGKELFDYILDQAIKLTDSKIGFYHQVSDNQNDIILTTWNNEALKNCEASYNTHYPIDKAGNWVDCVRMKQPVIYNDFPHSPNQKGLPDGHVAIKRFMSVPVLFENKVQFIFGVGNKEEDYDQHDVTQVQIIAYELQKIQDRIKAEDLLIKSEARYRELYVQSPLGYQSLDDNGCFIEVNNAWCKTLGYTREEVLGKCFADFLPPHMKEAFRERFPKFKEAGEVHNEFEMLHKEGYFINIAFDGKIGYNYDGSFKQTHCILHDITARKKIEQEKEEALKNLQTKSDELERYFNSSLDLLSIANTEGKFLRINPEWQRILGYPIHELEGNFFLDYVHPDDKEATLNALSQLKAQELITQFENRYRCKDGSYRWIEWRAKPIDENIYSVARDITDRKNIENSLRDSAQVFQSIPSGLFVYRYEKPDKLYLIDANPAALAYTNFELNDILGKEFNDIYPNAKNSGITDNFINAMHNMKPWHGEDVHYADHRLHGAYRIVVFPLGDDKMAVAFNDITEQKRSLQTTEQMAAMLDKAPNSITVHDITGKFLYANQRTFEMHGYTRDEFLALTLNEIDVPESRELIEERMKLISQNGEASFEVQHYHKEGSIIPLSIYVKLTDWFGKPAMLSIGSDISERLKYENTLKQSEERYRLLFENMTSAFALHEMIFDEDGKGVDYRFLEINPAFEKLTGIKASDIVGKTVKEVMPNTEQYWIDTYAGVAQSGVPISYRNFAGEINKYYDVMAFCPIKGQFAVVFNDITGSVLAEQKIKASEERYRSLFEYSPETIYIQSEGKIVMMNPAGLLLFGASSMDQIIGKPILDFVHPDFRDLVNERMKAVREQKQSYPLTEQKYLKLDGTSIDVELVAVPYDYNGVPSSQILVRDISKRKKMQEDLQYNEYMLKQQNEEYMSLNEELMESNNHIFKINEDLISAKEKAEEADRLKSAFLANMSHEIRTPMNSIMGFAEILEDPLLTYEKRKNFIRIIRQRSNDLLGIINDILDISKIEAGQMNLFEAEGDIATIFTDLSVYAEWRKGMDNKQIEFKTIIDPMVESSKIKADFGRLKQVLTNLVGNALKFTDKGFIETGCKLTGNNFLTFYVKDSGVGIPEDKLQIIFERFRQAEESYTNRRFGGTGLGLSISKGLVELMGGKIWVESVIDEGTVFYFTLPYKPTTTKSKTMFSQDTSATVDYNWEGMTILVVEDEINNMAYIEEILSRTKVNVLKAMNGEEAMEQFNAHPEINLILMDIRLPDTNGYDLTQQIIKVRHNLPVISQTAYASAEDKMKSLKSGCVDFVNKPLRRDLLLSTIDKYIRIKS